MTEPSATTVHHGDSLRLLRAGRDLGYDYDLGYEEHRLFPDSSIDAVVTDPPYGLEFMGKDWDSFRTVPSGGAGITATGYTDGAKRLNRPSFTGSPNPPCLNCGGTQRGAEGQGVKRCRCAAPDFPNVRRAQGVAYGDWCEQWAAECLRVLKPGGHLLAFGGTRTYHRLGCAIEDAGFEIRDSCLNINGHPVHDCHNPDCDPLLGVPGAAWLFGSGFPKSLDVSKAIDKRKDWALVGKLADAIRTARKASHLSLREVGDAVKKASGGVHGEWYHRGGHMFFETGMSLPGRAEWAHLRSVLPIPPEFDAVYEEAERVVVKERTLTQGGGTSLQIRMGEKRDVAADITAPATDAAKQWQGWGTALKPAFEPIVVARKPLAGTVAGNVLQHGTGALNINGCRVPHADDADRAESEGKNRHAQFGTAPGGNNVYGDFSQTAVRDYDGSAGRWPPNVVLDAGAAAALDQQTGVSQSRIGRPRGAAAGDGWGMTATGTEYADSGGASRYFPTFRYEAKAPSSERPTGDDGAGHPTVKPLDLMRWLVRLVTPPGGVVLDPFAGSGTTVEACLAEGMRCIAVERDAAYVQLISSRLDKPIQTALFP